MCPFGGVAAIAPGRNRLALTVELFCSPILSSFCNKVLQLKRVFTFQNYNE